MRANPSTDVRPTRLRGLEARLLLPICGTAAIALGALVTTIYVAAARSAREQAIEATTEMANRYAGHIAEQLGAVYASNRALASMFAGWKVAGLPADRAKADSVMHQFSRERPSVFGTWVAYEPNGFDGQDAAFANTPFHDKTGLFCPYWVYLDGKLQKASAFDGGNTPTTWDYYTGPKQTLKAVITDPYPYPVNGVTLLLATITSPMVRDGRFLGVAGSDMLLTDIQRQVAELKPGEHGYAILVANNGALLSYPDTTRLTKDLLAVSGDTAAREAVTAGRVHVTEGTSDVLHERVLTVYAPVQVGDLARPWSLAINVPTAVVYARAAQLRNLAVVFGVLTLVLLAGVVVVIVRRITRPLGDLAGVAERIALGDLRERPAYDGDDEIGRVASAFRAVVDAQRGIAEHATRLAAGDTATAIVARGEHDALAQGLDSLRRTLDALVREAGVLASAAAEGRLATRGDATRFAGSFGELVRGMNHTLDALGRPVEAAQSALERLAARDLTARIGGEYAGDHARIQRSFNQAAHALGEALARVGAATDQVAAAGGQIAAGSTTLASGASTQAASLEETSASLQELSGTARRGAEHALKARTLAEGAREGASIGVQKMHQLSSAITGIRSSADRTARIVKTIDEIAFQTNLLALNAAVEAARAGESGKGFAVVADGVRALAQRSAEAARQTADLIEEAVRNAETGVQLNAEMMAQLETIDERTRQVGAVMGDLASIGESQRDGVSQIARAVEQMNGVTQQVAAGAEESASAAEELGAQARMLADLVGEFRVGAVDEPVRGPAPRAAVRRALARGAR